MVNLDDFERVCDPEKGQGMSGGVLSKGAWAYYSTGSDDEWSESMISSVPFMFTKTCSMLEDGLSLRLGVSILIFS